MPLEVIGVDWPEYLAGLGARAYPAFELSWIADYPDPENFLAVLFGSGSAENHTGYSNPAFDKAPRRRCNRARPHPPPRAPPGGAAHHPG
ncbi:MAG: hypothetical protein U0232_28665 [Thermomicrobiales bacterium]